MPQLTHATHATSSQLRHACTSCGGCCQGVQVPIYNADEERLVRQAGMTLLVDRPIEAESLRMVDGRCVFLADDDRCRIHAEIGAQSKPIPCRQFPMIAVAVQDNVRIGIDPASYGAWRSWVDGPEIPDGPVAASRAPCPGGEDRIELALVTLCEGPDASVSSLLSALTREAAEPGEIPHGFADRWAKRLCELDFVDFLGRDGPGRRLVAALGPIAAESGDWGEGAPTYASLDPAADDWIVEATRRVLWLRLLPSIPNVSVAALMCLGGGLAAAWSATTRDEFHDGFTAWLRALRFELFWKTLAKDQHTVLWLATGQRPSP